MKYQIIKGSDTHFCSRAMDEVEQKVNDAIKSGWRPIGGINVFKEDNNNKKYVVSQAMVKDD